MKNTENLMIELMNLYYGINKKVTLSKVSTERSVNFMNLFSACKNWCNHILSNPLTNSGWFYIYINK